MKHPHWKVYFGFGLVMLSAGLYGLHYLIFRDAHQIFIYLLQDIGFVPIEVLMVTLVIHKVIEVREKQALMQKMNMAIGVFYSELGSELLKRCQEFDLDKGQLRDNLIVGNDWTPEKFGALIKRYRSQNMTLDCTQGDLPGLKQFLIGRRQFLLGLLENPNLLEHEQFTDLLWAVFHLSDELGCRADIEHLTDPDCAHLAGDVKRAYALLITGWLTYMMHLKADYPYLFSLAVRTNPFNAAAKPEVC